MLNRLLHIAFLLALTATAWAQNPYLTGKLQGGSGVPGTQSRSPLNSLERAANNLAGVTILTDTFGNQRLAMYVRIEDTCIHYTPAATGNTANLSAFVEKCSTDSIWYIDWTGASLFFGTAGATCDEDWLQISDNSCPDAITDSIYHQKYAAIGARLVWPTAELLVNDSASVLVTLLSGNRNVRLGFWDNFNQVYSTIDQSGVSSIWYFNPTGELRFTTAGGGTPQSPGAPFVNQFALNPADSPLPTVQAHLYPNTRVDTFTVRNFLYTDVNGKFRGRPIDSLVQIVVDSISSDTSLAVNWYTTNGVTDDLLRTATVKRSAWWRSIDTIGFLRLQAGLIDGGRINVNQDSVAMYFEGGTRENWVSVRPNYIRLVTTGGLASINLLTDTINFYDRYTWAKETPSFTVGDTSFHFWAGNGINTNPGFITLDEIRGPDFGENIYNTSDLLQNGGTTVGLDSGSLKFNLRTTAAATVYGIEMLGNSATGSNRFVSFRTEVDSMRFQESSGDYLMIVSTDFQNNVTDQYRTVADSIQWIEGSVETKATQRFLLGMTPTGWMKRFDGNDATAGDVIASNGTDWVVSSPGSLGYVLQNGNSFGAAMVIGTNDNNSLSFETNGVTRATATAGASTGGAWTFTNVTANTATVQDVFTVRANSTGTAGANFGVGLLFQGESSTTDNRDMAYIRPIWQTATDATRRSNLTFGTVQSGVFSEGFRLNQTTIQNASGTTLVLGGTSSPVVVGNSTGTVEILSTGTGSVNQIRLSASGDNTNTSGTLGNASYTTTSGTKYDWRISSSFQPTSGTGIFYNLLFNGGINQTGGANGVVGAISFEPTLTAVGTSWSALTMATSNSSAKFLNQTGANTTSTHVGAFGFGSTTVPTDKVEVTGNLALLTAGNKLKIATGSNASVGTSAAMTAGTITISTTAVTANSIILLTGIDGSTPCATCGDLSIGTITAGTSFVINSSLNTDTRTVNWLIIN